MFKKELMLQEKKFIPIYENKGINMTKKLWCTRSCLTAITRKHKSFNKFKDSKHPAYVAAANRAAK